MTHTTSGPTAYPATATHRRSRHRRRPSVSPSRISTPPEVVRGQPRVRDAASGDQRRAGVSKEAMIGPAGADASGPPSSSCSLARRGVTIAKFIARSGAGLQQLAVRVTDVDAVCRASHRRRNPRPYTARSAAWFWINFVASRKERTS